MQQLVAYARSTFWTIGIIEILTGAYVAAMAVTLAAQRHKPTSSVLLAFALLCVGLGALVCMAASSWRRRDSFSRPLVAFASVTSLPFFPFGAVAGGVGLYWCCSRRLRATEPALGSFDHQSRAGDGTHPWVQKAMPFASGAIWLGALAAANRWGRAHGLPQHPAFDGIALILVCELAAAFFHELGHAVAGWASAMSPISFRVGPFAFTKRAGRWSFRFVVGSILGGGAVATVPLRHLKRLRSRMAFEVAGGPVASLLTFLIAMTITMALPGTRWQVWWKIPAVLAVIAAGEALLNLIPFGFAAGYSDGALLVQLLGGGRFADLRAALKMVGLTTASPTRPRDLDTRVLENGARAAAGTPEETTLQLIQLVCAVDRGELGAAREHLESSLKKIPAPSSAHTAGAAAEIGLYMAYLDGNATRAAKWMQETERFAASKNIPLAGKSDYWRALTALREAEGQTSEAEEAYRRATQLLANRPASGLYQAERDLLETLRRRDWLRPPIPALSETSV